MDFNHLSGVPRESNRRAAVRRIDKDAEGEDLARMSEHGIIARNSEIS